MNIVWMSWKDRSHPLAGGAETVSGQIMDRLARDGHTVTLLTSSFSGANPSEMIQGVQIIRAGSKYSVYLKARQYYKRNLSIQTELVIDEMNTIPFASAFYTRTPTMLLSYQLARRVWFYQMVFPFSVIGYLLEPLYLRLMAYKYPFVLTESESTRYDMSRYGFPAANVHIFKVGMALKPVTQLLPKQELRTILSLGAIRPMKRTLHAVKAFEAARDVQSDLEMVVAGDTSGPYGKKVLSYIKRSRHTAAIKVLGRVSNEVRLQLMHDAAVILVASVKEGWGLIVTEANSQGTPAIVYNTDGLRDSVQNGKTGMLVANGNIIEMGRAVVTLVNNLDKYENIRQAGWQQSKSFTFEDSYQSFLRAASLQQND